MQRNEQYWVLPSGSLQSKAEGSFPQGPPCFCLLLHFNCLFAISFKIWTILDKTAGCFVNITYVKIDFEMKSNMQGEMSAFL